MSTVEDRDKIAVIVDVLLRREQLDPEEYPKDDPEEHPEEDPEEDSGEDPEENPKKDPEERQGVIEVDTAELSTNKGETRDGASTSSSDQTTSTTAKRTSQMGFVGFNPVAKKSKK